MRLAVLGLVIACGCAPNRPCRPETALVDVMLAGAAVEADSLEVRVSVDGVPGRATSLAHRPGRARGNVEIAFPAGYPAGRSATVTVTARAGATEVGSGRAVETLAPGCSALAVSVGVGADGGDGDAATADASPPCNAYASPSGSDTMNFGTLDSPFATLGHLASTLEAGQVGCLLDGDYPADTFLTRGGTPGAPIVLRGSGNTVLRGYLEVTDAANELILERLRVDGTARAGNTIEIFGDNVTLRDCDITNQHGAGTKSCVSIGSGSIGIAVNTRLVHNRIHDCGSGVNDRCIDARYTLGLEISDNVIYGALRYGVEFYPQGHGSLMAFNVVDGNGDDGVVFSGEATNPSSSNVVTRNLITFNADEGIGVYWGGAPGSGNQSLENCLFGNVTGSHEPPVGFTITGAVTGMDPQYLDRAARDYRLAPGSPCAGYGPRY